MKLACVVPVCLSNFGKRLWKLRARALGNGMMGSNQARSNAPRVSMIMPVHNGARWLQSAIDSVLAQSFTSFELILVDDASSDESPAIMVAAQAQDERVRYVRLDTNVGLPAALNRGFAEASGDLHSWTSDDNLLRPLMLEKLVALLDAHPDVGVAHSDFTVIDEDGQDQYLAHVGPIERLLFNNNVGASFLYRSSVTDALGGYDTGLFGVEDYDFWLRAAKGGFQFMPLHEDLYRYRKHGGSLTSQRAGQIQDLTAMIVERGLPADLPKETRSQILLGLVFNSQLRWRFDLLMRAFRAQPTTVLAKTPQLLRWTVAVARNRLFGLAN